jgi:hypothetical protein
MRVKAKVCIRFLGTFGKPDPAITTVSRKNVEKSGENYTGPRQRNIKNEKETGETIHNKRKVTTEEDNTLNNEQE